MLTLSKSLITLIKTNTNIRPCRVLDRALTKLKYHGSSRLVNPKLPGNYFTFREKQGMISYMPSGRDQMFNDDGTWQRKGRQEMTPGKWLKAIINPRVVRLMKIKDSELGQFATALKAEESRHEVAIVKCNFDNGYNEDNYQDEGLPDSCMWGDPVGEFYSCFDCQLMVAKDLKSGLYLGRAIVWNSVERIVTPRLENIRFMDRVYSYSEAVEQIFFDWAKENGIWYKARQSAQELKGIINPETGACEFYKLRVSGSPSAEFYPYLDTFRWGDDCRNCNWEFDGLLYTYDSTGGDRGEENVVYINGEAYQEDSDEICYCDGEWRLRDECCYVSGEWYRKDDDAVVYSEYEDDYILAESAVCVNDEWYRDNCRAIVYSESEGEYIMRDDAVQASDGEWYHKDSDEIVTCHDGVIRVKDDCVEVNGSWYPEDSELITEDDDGNYITIEEYKEKQQLKLSIETEKETANV